MGLYLGSEKTKMYGAGVYRGEDGGYYTPSVTQTGDTTVQVAYIPSDSSMEVIPSVDIDLPRGEKGDNGAGVKSMTYNSSTNKWTVALTDGTSLMVDGPAIPDVSSYMPKSGGTFTGAVQAATAATGSYYVRNIKFSMEAETPAIEGDICFKLA